MKMHGFSLIELMFVLVIVGILATFSYPMFQESIARCRRIDGQTALLDLANRMERYFAENHSYEGATLGTGANTDLLLSNRSPQNWYILAITKQTANSFSLQAIPVQTQALHDKACQMLGLNNLGVKTAECCW